MNLYGKNHKGNHVLVNEMKGDHVMVKINRKNKLENSNYNHGKIENKRILFISDDRFMRIVIRNMLKDENYSLVMAYDGRDGYEKYVTHQPQLIVTDIEIPQINGLDLCKMIKMDINDQKTPVILYTSSTKREDVKKAFDFKVNAYVTKDQKPEKLKEQIISLLS